jgi:hypothetical protein
MVTEKEDKQIVEISMETDMNIKDTKSKSSSNFPNSSNRIPLKQLSNSLASIQIDKTTNSCLNFFPIESLSPSAALPSLLPSQS